MQSIVTIDGPSGVGKSSVSRKIASKLGYTYLDTGAMYRGVGFFMHSKGVDITSEKRVKEHLLELDLSLLPATSVNEDVGVVINTRDVSDFIRTPEISMVASKISTLPEVRDFLTEMQRKIGGKGQVVAEGRDMGTVVFPDAAHKFYLEAQPEVRCERRVLQMRGKGEEVNEKEMLALIVERDKNDSEREVAPLRKAEDAHLIDTSNLSLDEVCDQIYTLITKPTP